jgi:hypothetical protein
MASPRVQQSFSLLNIGHSPPDFNTLFTLRKSLLARTYVVCEGTRVVAYVCISAGAVERAAAPGRVRRNAPDAIPISVIGRLRDLLGFKDYRYRLVYFPRSSPQKRRLQPAKKTVSDGEVRRRQ